MRQFVLKMFFANFPPLKLNPTTRTGFEENIQTEKRQSQPAVATRVPPSQRSELRPGRSRRCLRWPSRSQFRGIWNQGSVAHKTRNPHRRVVSSCCSCRSSFAQHLDWLSYTGSLLRKPPRTLFIEHYHCRPQLSPPLNEKQAQGAP